MPRPFIPVGHNATAKAATIDNALLELRHLAMAEGIDPATAYKWQTILEFVWDTAYDRGRQQ